MDINIGLPYYNSNSEPLLLDTNVLVYSQFLPNNPIILINHLLKFFPKRNTILTAIECSLSQNKKEFMYSTLI